jgi:hypothetical protein
MSTVIIAESSSVLVIDVVQQGKKDGIPVLSRHFILVLILVTIGSGRSMHLLCPHNMISEAWEPCYFKPDLLS